MALAKNKKESLHMSQNPVDTARAILEKIEMIDEIEKPVLDSETYNKDATGKGDEVHTDEGPNNAKKNKKSVTPHTSAAKAGLVPSVKPEGGNQAGGGVTEDLDALFNGEDLTEDFKLKVITIFEAAINEKIENITYSLEEEYSDRLTEEVAQITEELTNKIDEYLDYAVQNWISENELTVEQGIRTEVTESFMEGLKTLFDNHYIEIPESKVDLVDELAEENEELVTRLNNEIQASMDMAEELLDFKRSYVFNEMSEGLVDTEVEKFKTLSEGVEHADIEEYIEKLDIIRESYFGEYNNDSFADDTTEGTPEVTGMNSLMEGYAKAITRSSSSS
jgi:hypothetical protein